MSAQDHRKAASRSLRCAVLTVSDTRTLETDRGGDLVVELLLAAGHHVAARQIATDEPAAIGDLVRRWVADASIDAVLLTGGTGISPRDQTYETIAALLTKPLPGYGELFRKLSFEEIGAAAMLSRAVGGVCERTIVLTMPGSTAAVQLAMDKLIVPELPHLVHEATKHA
jgi:molybdenum cofactor biosynthesis protein B